MTDYKKGKIYAIKSNETDQIYIGSTCSTLKNRMCSHKCDYKRIAAGKKFYTSCSHQILKYADAYIELVESYPCQTKRELLDREGEVIRNTPNCINIQIQGRTMAQYRIDNAEKLKQQGKDYRAKNKELLKKTYSDWYKSDGAKAYYKKRYEKVKGVKSPCPTCGKNISVANLSRHMKLHQPPKRQ